MADWEEIKRLAADFQRAQLSSTILKLSERNCIEIVQKLVEFSLLEIIYTTDGKEYLTPQELGKEIREELIARGGRVSLGDLQTALNVDFSHVEAKAKEIVKGDEDIYLILGQLVDQSYLDTVVEEINDILQDDGQITLTQIVKDYDLPGNFISQLIAKNLGSVIKGQMDDYDKNIIFTEAFVNRHKAIIRGAFSAVTRPVQVSVIINMFGLNERLFFTILEELVSKKQLAGVIAGGRQERAQYIPDIHTKSQNDWVENFYRQNGYLEYDALTRLGISDPRGFIKKRLKSESLQYLSSCCIGKSLQERIEGEIDEAVSSGGWLDIQPSLPSICSENDANQLLTVLLRRKHGTHVFCDTIVTSDQLISDCQRQFEPIIATKAEQVARSNPAFLMPDKQDKGKAAAEDSNIKEDRKDQRRKKATTGKSGGGTQGREVKMKSTKKKAPRGKDRDMDDSDDETVSKGRSVEREFLVMEDIEQELKKMKTLEDCPDELVTGVAERLHRPLNKQFLEAAKSVFLLSTGGASGSSRRKTHGELAEKINSLWVNVKLFEKSLKFFADDTQAHLVRHMLKTICSDIANMIFTTVATEHMVSFPDEDITQESRMKILPKIPDEKTKKVLSSLHLSLNGKSLDDFLKQLDTVCDPEMLDINLRKADKKKERQVVFNHRQALSDQLRQELDPALGLHLSAVLLFQVYTQNMIHVPGRCVPQVIGFLQQHMGRDDHRVLVQCQDLVIKQLRASTENADSPDDSSEITRELEELLPKVKDITFSTRKGGSAQAAED